MREESVQTLFGAQLLRRLYQRALGIYRKFRLHGRQSSEPNREKSPALMGTGTHQKSSIIQQLPTIPDPLRRVHGQPGSGIDAWVLNGADWSIHFWAKDSIYRSCLLGKFFQKLWVSPSST